MLNEMDTIVAIASGCTNSGIGVIRMSGEESRSILGRVFEPVKNNVDVLKMKTYTAHYGHIVVPDSGEILDECVVLYMKGPHSYTGEDTVEIDAHGGIYVCNQIVSLLCKNGARLAEPGEYTKRAFINGRMDLTQAEAVMDVIQADNQNALTMSMKQLKGQLKDEIIAIREQIIHENAYIEYALDDPEHVSLEGFSDKLNEILDKNLIKIDNLLKHADEGRMLKEGIQTVIVGSPNAGKSSLLNVLLQEERAIVTDIPGTTRDTLEERAFVGGIPLNIVDTAGIHETSDLVEQIGVDKAKKVIEAADLILYVVDQSKVYDEEEQLIVDLIQNKKVIVLLNKSDLNAKTTVEDIRNHIKANIISVSMQNKDGIDNFYKLIQEMFFEGQLQLDYNLISVNERQKMNLEKAKESLLRVKESIVNNMPEDFFTIDLLDAYESLGLIIGESVNDDLVNQIFAEFCTGK